MGASNTFIIIAVVITLGSGTFSAVATKVLYQKTTDGLCGPHVFVKPYMFTLWMFIGEALCLGYFYFNSWLQSRSKSSRESEPLLTGDSDHAALLPSAGEDGAAPVDTAKKPPVWVYVVLSLFDLSATSINGVGLTWVTASTNQMLRGSAVLFTGIFSMLILKKRLSVRQWTGIGVVIGGLALVGGAAAAQAKWDEEDGKQSDDDKSPSPMQALIGVLLVLVGSALNSCQNVFEEKLLKATGSASIDALEVVGWEGVSGTFFSSFVLLPIAQQIPGSDCGCAENTTDSLVQMGNSVLVVMFLVGYAIALALMNYFSQIISKYLSAVHRMLVSTLRTVLVWVVNIILYYLFTHQSFGEPWVKSSYIQLGGFALLIIGTAVYGLKPAENRAPEPDTAPTLPYATSTSGFQTDTSVNHQL